MPVLKPLPHPERLEPKPAAVAPPPTAAPKPPAPPPPTPEEIAKQAEDVSQALGRTFGKDAIPSKPAEPPKPATEPAPEPPSAGATPPPEPPKPAAPPAPEPPPEPPAPKPMGRDELEEIVQGVMDRNKPPAEPPPAPLALPAAPALDAQQQYELPIYRKMEGMKPQYQGLADRMVKYWEALETWTRTWMTAHPGEEPSENDQEFQAWQSAHQPDFEAFDFDVARDALIKEQAKQEFRTELDERDKKHKDELERVRREQQLREEAPKINRLAATAVYDLAAAALPEEYKPLIEQARETGKIDALDQKLVADDPATLQLLKEESEEVFLMVKALEVNAKFSGTNLANQFYQPVELVESKRDFVPGHQLDLEIYKIEREMMEAPKSQTTVDGREYVTQAEMEGRLNSIMASKSINEQQKKAAAANYLKGHWTMDAEAMRRGIIARRAEKLGKKIERMRGFTTKRQPAAPKPDNGTPPATPPAEPASAPVRSPKPRSPSVSSESDAVNPPSNRSTVQQKDDEALAKRMGWA